MKEILDYLDSKGIRSFVKYSTATGKWGIECWRKKKASETKGESDWEMVREGSTQSYFTRKEAVLKSIELGFRIGFENNFLS